MFICFIRSNDCWLHGSQDVLYIIRWSNIELIDYSASGIKAAAAHRVKLVSGNSLRINNTATTSPPSPPRLDWAFYMPLLQGVTYSWMLHHGSSNSWLRDIAEGR